MADLPYTMVDLLDTMVDTVPPVSRHWSCQSDESNLRARISGDVQAETSRQYAFGKEERQSKICSEAVA